MSAPPFLLLYTEEASKGIRALRTKNPGKHKKILKTVKTLRDIGPSYPSLNSHKYSSLTGPRGEDLWESYIENHTPGAWRIFWVYDPDSDQLTIISVGPHP